MPANQPTDLGDSQASADLGEGTAGSAVAQATPEPPSSDVADAQSRQDGPSADESKPALRGHFDRADGGRATGWAFDPSAPKTRLEIEIRCAEEVIAKGIADRFRQELLDAGIGDGCHAFEIAVDLDPYQRRLDQLDAGVVGHAARLGGEPLKHRAKQARPARLQADHPTLPAFDNTRDTRFFYPSASHAEALSRLFLLTQDRNMGIGVLTGDIGAGKTLLRTLLFARLADDRHLRVSIENCLLDFDGLLLEILSQMRGERLAPIDFPDRYTRLAELKRLLLEQVASRDRHLVVLIDEAQQLEPDTLAALKGLTNITSERQNFLTLILIGQPELRLLLKQIPEVDQRVSLHFHLNGLDRVETGYYVRHRLRTAGFTGELPVTDSGLDRLYELTRGIPREINRIAKLAIDHILTQDLQELDEQTIEMVIKDLRRHSGLEAEALHEL